jgi:hypothetical protein
MSNKIVSNFEELFKTSEFLARDYENHCLLVMKDIAEAFVEIGADRTTAALIVNAISRYQIPRVTIDFAQEK